MSYANLTLQALQTLLIARFDNQAGFFSNTLQQQALNEGLSIFQLATGRWRQRFIVTTVAERCFYFVDGLPQLQVGGICQVLAPVRASFNGSPPLAWTSWNDMDAIAAGWQAQTTATLGCPTAPAMIGPAGVNIFFLWPSDADGNNSLALDCLINAPKLVNPGDYVNLDNTEAEALLDFSEYRLSAIRGGLFAARTLPLRQSFFRMLVQRNSYLINIAAYRQAVGADWARNFYPRRMNERGSREVGVGLR